MKLHPFRVTRITKAEAQEALQHFVNLHFWNAGQKSRASIPANQNDDDILLFDYITQREAEIAGLREELRKVRKNALTEAASVADDASPAAVGEIGDRIRKLAAEGPQGTALAPAVHPDDQEYYTGPKGPLLQTRKSEPPPAPDWCDVCQAPQMVLPDGSHVCKKPAPEVKHEWMGISKERPNSCSCGKFLNASYREWQAHVASQVKHEWVPTHDDPLYGVCSCGIKAENGGLIEFSPGQWQAHVAASSQPPAPVKEPRGSAFSKPYRCSRCDCKIGDDGICGCE